ncbi:MAG: carboxypeptidase-like regulatory domain-containing protein [Breznakibacter sp.]
MQRIFLFIFLIITCFWANGQTQVSVRGVVTDAENGKPIPYARLASYEKMAIFPTDSAGRFLLMLEQSDSLRVLALGYSSKTLKIKQILADGSQYFTIPLARTSIMLKQVDVYTQSANEHLQRAMPDGIVMGYNNPTPVELRSDVGGKPPVIAAVTNPMSFAYYHMSKRERRKRKMQQLIASEQGATLMNKELVGEITGLQAQELDDFFVYCNANIKLTGKESSGYIRIRIIETFEKYKTEKNGQRKE